ncbi:MAG: sensor histidine kinase [Flavobacteriales bacterium]
MRKGSSKRPVLLLYLLGTYIVLQFAWWAYLLISSNEDRLLMVIGEGCVFLLLLLFGMYRLKRAFAREIALAEQERNFMMAVTHELRSPITSVKLFLQTLRRTNDDPEQMNLADRAIAETDRLNGLVDNILLASRIESKAFTLTLKEEDLGENVRSALETPERTIGSEHPTEYRIEEGVRARIDPEALRSVVLNLYENAVKYSPAGSSVTVQVDRAKGYARVRVKDEGPGIENAQKRNVLQKFVRGGKESERESKGTGLGLYIVQQLVHMQEGDFRLRDSEEGGTVAEVLFPLV